MSCYLSRLSFKTCKKNTLINMKYCDIKKCFQYSFTYCVVWVSDSFYVLLWWKYNSQFSFISCLLLVVFFSITWIALHCFNLISFWWFLCVMTVMWLLLWFSKLCRVEVDGFPYLWENKEDNWIVRTLIRKRKEETGPDMTKGTDGEQTKDKPAHAGRGEDVRDVVWFTQKGRNKTGRNEWIDLFF